MGRGRRTYPEDFKRDAVRVLQEVGPNEAARRTGVAKDTLYTWAKKQGVDVKAISQEVAVHQAQASARAAQVRSEERRRRMEDRLDRLLDLSGVALARELQILGNAEQKWGKDELQAVTNARYKAIHDLQLLLGKATERTESGNAEVMIDMVKEAFVLSLVDAGLADEQIERVRSAFAYRIRQAAVSEA